MASRSADLIVNSVINNRDKHDKSKHDNEHTEENIKNLTGQLMD